MDPTPMDVTPTVRREPVVASDRTPLDWRRPFRVLRLARRAGVTPWEALAWLEAVLEDFEVQEAAFGDGAAYGAPGVPIDGLPWPPDG